MRPASVRAGTRSKQEIADSWEDESDDGNEILNQTGHPSGSSASYQVPESSLSGAATSAWSTDSQTTTSNTFDEDDENPVRRPEKTDAVARRMIAAGLGLKAPKQTEEQKAYQRSIREQEKKRREQEKLQEQKRREEDEKAKAAMWED